MGHRTNLRVPNPRVEQLHKDYTTTQTLHNYTKADFISLKNNHMWWFEKKMVPKGVAPLEGVALLE